jgi:DNA-binding transcriptional ArsR family regulator
MKDMAAKVAKASSYLAGLASPHRLAILCQLAEGEKCVSDLIAATGLPQTSMSQHLSKLRKEGIVTYRREHRVLFYSIVPGPTLAIMQVLHGHFCTSATPKGKARR